jgi:signal transduction protein with GAF and PtsI domain
LFGSVGGVALLGSLVGLWLQSGLAVGALAVFSLCMGAWWYSVRLERALDEVRQQSLFSQRTVERMQLLLETVHRLLAAPNIDRRLRILGEAAARLVNAERATLFLIDEARGELWSRFALGEEQGEIRIPLGSGIAGSVALTGKLISIDDPYADPRFNQDVDRRTGFRTRNLLTLPMLDANGRCLGVFQVLNKRGGAFGPEDVEILSQLTRSASMLVRDEPA